MSVQAVHSDDKTSSIRSFATTPSDLDTVSLTRRSRTRTRATTLPVSFPAGRDTVPAMNASNEPTASLQPPLDNPSSATIPPRPPRSPYRLETHGEPSNSTSAAIGTAPTDAILDTPLPPQDHPIAPRHAPTTSRDTALSSKPRFRDSVHTHQSSSSVSIYPPSTSTASGTDSTAPRSVPDPDAHYDLSSYEPEMHEPDDFDSDDVSYRLRLLVKNNYFLPPAHSKPTPSDFALNASKGPLRSTAPHFLDLFRVGKSKSKSPTPHTSPESAAPILRTTSDSTTASGYVVHPPPRSLPLTPISPGNPSQDRTGRVVVVREKMSDLIGAAKQAELEMKSRSNRRDQGSPRAQEVDLEDVIDPTDAVDLPPPSAGYPFAVQASAAHGLGVEDSVGAALLAEHLPPRSPGPSLSPEEYAWRKALLHAAVGHSLQNSPAVSPSPAASTPLNLSISSTSTTPPRPISAKRLLGQQIINQPLFEQHEVSSAMPPRVNTTLIPKGRRERGLASPDSLDSFSRPPSHFPPRAESPTAHPTPLAPPPRKLSMNPLYSLSQSDLTHSPEPRPSFSSTRGLRKTASSPRLTNIYESKVREIAALTPPPMVGLQNSRTSSRSRLKTSFETNRAMASIATTTDSHYSDEGNEPPRLSTTLSIPTRNRPSLSDYSQPSPSASAFQDALNFEYHSSSSRRSVEAPSLAPRVSNASPGPRYSTMSPPPPRVSSSLGNIALSPPPRSSSLHPKSTTFSGRSFSSPDTGYHTPVFTPQQISAPEPSHLDRVPEPRRLPTLLPIQIPTKPIPVSIQSAPPPSSPVSFFDHLQSYPNAMDDLESSSDEDDSESDERPPPVYVNPQTRAVSNLPLPTRTTLTKLGNHSTPYVSRSYERRPSLPIGPPGAYRSFDPKKPVGNMPPRLPYFNDKKSGKSDHGHGVPISTLDLYRYKQQYMTLGEPSNRPATSVTKVRAPTITLTSQESLKKLDGMLIQHMEAERDTIKRIATSVHHPKT